MRARRAQVDDRGVRLRRPGSGRVHRGRAAAGGRAGRFARDIVEVEGYVRGFGRRRPDVAVTRAAVRQLPRPHASTPRSPVTSRSRSCRRCSASTPGCSSCTWTTPGDPAPVGDRGRHPATFNVAGAGVMLAVPGRPPGRPGPRARAGARCRAGRQRWSRNIGVVDISAEQIAVSVLRPGGRHRPAARRVRLHAALHHGARRSTSSSPARRAATLRRPARRRARVLRGASGATRGASQPPRRTQRWQRPWTRPGIQLHAADAVGRAPRPAVAAKTSPTPRARRRRAGTPPTPAEPVPRRRPAREPTGGTRAVAGARLPAAGSPGEYEVDEFGFDPELTDTCCCPLLRPLYEKWFRVEVSASRTSRTSGGALIVANHAGAFWALDAVMTAVAVHDRAPRQPHLRLLGADLVFRAPGLGQAGPQGRRHAGVQRGRRAAAGRRRAGRRVARGLQGHRQAVPRAVQAAALRPGRIRDAGARDRRADHPGVDRRRRGDPPDAGRRQAARPAARPAVLPDHADVPVARAARARPAAEQVVHRVRRRRSNRRTATRRRPEAVSELADQVRETIQATLYRLLVQRRSVWR